MKENQGKDRVNEAKGEFNEGAHKATVDESTEYKGKDDRRGGKDRAVLADINDDANKAEKSTQKETK